ncbi:MAG: hypothetical protein P8N76_25665 [Pirellulaceae bacterium]|nr:hypothetical protein [Pirellulaceae bacterium]
MLDVEYWNVVKYNREPSIKHSTADVECDDRVEKGANTPQILLIILPPSFYQIRGLTR